MAVSVTDSVAAEKALNAILSRCDAAYRRYCEAVEAYALDRSGDHYQAVTLASAALSEAREVFREAAEMSNDDD